MASLNWAVLDPISHTPTPLPNERPLLTLTDITITLTSLAPPPRSSSIPAVTSAASFSTPTSLSARLAPIASSSISTLKTYLLPDSRTSGPGRVYLSTLRILFVANTAKGGGGTGAAEGYGTTEVGSIQTMSVPFTHFLDGKFVQPWFGATYYEGKAWPAGGGGLEAPHHVTYNFKSSGGYKFYQIVEEMKNRITLGRPSAITEEPLPVYEPLALAAAPSTAGNDGPPPSDMENDAPPGYEV